MRGSRHPPGGLGIRMIAAAALAFVSLSPMLMLTAAPARAAPDLLPDLVAEPSANPQVPQVSRFADGQNHLLMRFDGTIHNAGAGPLEIRGSTPVNGVMTVSGQRIYRSDGSYHDDNRRRPPIHFENTDGHRHWHLTGAARYSLWTEAGTAEVAPASKVGFCLLDSERVDSFAPRSPVYTKSGTQYCREGQPNAAQVLEGISAGWLDFYAAALPFQWVDLSDVAPGRYRLGAEVDPSDFVVENNEANNGPALATSTVTVPGYVASPVAAAVPESRPVTIGLAAEQHGSPGPRIFQLESAPSHGTLDRTAGAPFSESQLVYTPRPGFTGRDTFTYSARDSSTSFPLHPPPAAVTVAVSSTEAARKTQLRLVSGLRFSRRGRTLIVRARARKSGTLRIQIKKSRRNLGSCRGRVRSGRRFVCRIKLRRHVSPARAKAIFSLSVKGQPTTVNVFRVPRRLNRG